jgi:hypothetical protein
MEHDAHLADDVDQAGSSAKIISLLVVIVALFGTAAYIIFGPGI